MPSLRLLIPGVKALEIAFPESEEFRETMVRAVREHPHIKNAWDSLVAGRSELYFDGKPASTVEALRFHLHIGDGMIVAICPPLE